MMLSLDEVLKYVKPEDSLHDVILAQDNRWVVEEISPRVQDIEKFREHMVSLSDIFYLEVPRTYYDLIRRRDVYGLSINLQVEAWVDRLGYDIHACRPYLGKTVRIEVAQFNGVCRVAIGKVSELTEEDVILVKEDQYGRQCIDYKDILDLEIVKVTPEEMYTSLTGEGL